MTKTFTGQLMGEGHKFGIIVSRFNEFFTSKLLSGCLDALMRHGAREQDIEVAWAPGAFEIPLIAQKMAAKDYDAVICLGVIIRGATPHFEYVSAEVTKGVAQVGLSSGKPVIYGVVTADSIEQAVERSGAKAGNKGVDAAVTAIEMVNLLQGLD